MSLLISHAMIRKLLLSLLVLVFIAVPALVKADVAPLEIVAITPQIDAEDSVEVDRNIIFSAAQSTSLEEGELSYGWHFGDGNQQTGVEVAHSYAESGAYVVTLTVRDQSGNTATSEFDVFVYEKAFVLISMVDGQDEKIQSIVDEGRSQGIYFKWIPIISSGSSFLEEEELRRQLLEHVNDLETSNDLIFYTEGSSGLTVLSRLGQTLSDEDFFTGKNIYFISELKLFTLENIAKGIFSIMDLNRIVLTRPEALWVLLETSDLDSFISVLNERGIEFSDVDGKLKLRPWNFLSVLVNTLLNNGVPTGTLLLVLMLPVIATLVAFMKQVLGLNTLGVYTPAILSLSFIALNFWYGLIIFVVLFAVGSVVRAALHHYRLLYIPRMAIILSFSTFAILLVLFLGTLFNQAMDELAVFPILIMATMVEKFVTIQSDKGFKGALRIWAEVLFVAMLAYLFVQWNTFEVLVLGHPEILFFFLALNFLMARWTGLRITEYIRFRELIRHVEE